MTWINPRKYVFDNHIFFDIEKIIAQMKKELPEEDPNNPGSFVKRIYIGSIFTHTPSGKYYTPFANSNVKICSACYALHDTGPCNITARCKGENVGESGHCEVCLDAAWREIVDIILGNNNLVLESGEGDPTDLFICQYLTSDDLDRAVDEPSKDSM